MELERLKKMRLDAHMTCQDIAERIGITKNYYWLIERGDRNLSYPLAVKIANVFGLEPDDIFLTKKST